MAKKLDNIPTTAQSADNSQRTKWTRGRVMGGIGCMMAAGAATVAFSLRGPQAAGANQPAGNESFASAVSVPPTRSSTAPETSAAHSQKLTETLNFAPARVQVPLMELKTNPFRQGQEQMLNADAQADAGTRAQREQQRQSALQEVQSLRLEGITHQGTSKACTINNIRYHEGQEADGFLVEEIASNIVVLRKGAYRFELKPSL